MVVSAFAADTLPPKPDKYFNDYVGLFSADKARALNERLAQLERSTSMQILVAVYGKMDSESDIADYANRIYKLWQPGQAGTNNGAILLVFKDSRKMRIEVGYGLESVLTDAATKVIQEETIIPLFRKGQYAMGIEAGVDAIIKTAAPEYAGKGKGKTVAESGGVKPKLSPLWITLIVIGAIFGIVFLIKIGCLGLVLDILFAVLSARGGGGGGGGFSGGGGNSGGGGSSSRW